MLEPAATAEKASVHAQRALIEAGNATLHVDGTEFGIVRDILEDKRVAYWTITEPLEPGTHEVELSVSYEPRTDAGVADIAPDPPRVRTHPSNVEVSWADGTLTAVSELTVSEETVGDSETVVDPLWGRKDVYQPLDRAVDDHP